MIGHLAGLLVLVVASTLLAPAPAQQQGGPATFKRRLMRQEGGAERLGGGIRIPARRILLLHVVGLQAASRLDKEFRYIRQPRKHRNSYNHCKV